jgi:hypothetical protein
MASPDLQNKTDPDPDPKTGVPKRPRQEERSATLTPKVEGVPVTTSHDRFEAIVKALGEL